MVSVAFCIGSENVADTVAPTLTAVAPLAGTRVVTVGGVTSAGAVVVKLHDVFAASEFPATSLTAVVTVAVYCVLPARPACGV